MGERSSCRYEADLGAAAPSNANYGDFVYLDSKCLFRFQMIHLRTLQESLRALQFTTSLCGAQIPLSYSLSQRDERPRGLCTTSSARASSGECAPSRSPGEGHPKIENHPDRGLKQWSQSTQARHVNRDVSSSQVHVFAFGRVLPPWSQPMNPRCRLKIVS